MNKKGISTLIFATFAFISCQKEGKTVETDQIPVEKSTSNSINGEKYTVQPSESSIHWEGGKVTGDHHSGTIRLQQGEIFVDEGKITIAKFVIDMNTIEVTDIQDVNEKAGLEGHLKGTVAEKEDHFFNTTQYPRSEFEITNITEEKGKQMIEGTLRLKGNSHQILFPASVTITPTEVRIVSDPFEIDRTKWGVNYNSGSVMKDLAAEKVIKDNIKIELQIKATK